MRSIPWHQKLTGLLKSQLSDRQFTTLRHRRAYGVMPNLDAPSTFSEKVCLRKLYPTPSMSVLSDKVAARDYVRQRVGEDILIPCYAFAEELTPELFESLPSQFVMKANHGSGYNLLVEDKSQWSYPVLYDISRNWLSHDYSTINRESQYRLIKPRLLFEKRLGPDSPLPPSDYKFHCFRKNGELTIIVQIIMERFGEQGSRRFCVTPDWEPVHLETGEVADISEIEKPEGFDRAVTLADRLSEGFNYVRVDFYILEGQVYFGELTFTPNGGYMKFRDQQANHYLGSLFDIEEELERSFELMPSPTSGPQYERADR